MKIYVVNKKKERSGWKKIFPVNTNQKKAGVATLY